MSHDLPHKEPHRPTDHETRTTRRAKWGEWSKQQERNKTARGRRVDADTKWT